MGLKGSNDTAVVMSDNHDQSRDSAPDRGGSESSENGASGPSRSHFTIAINYASLSGNDEQAGNDAANTAFTPMILRFADVPSDTSSGRLNEVIALASEYIFQTLTRDQRRHSGLTREAFEKLEVQKVDTLDEKTCAICYDDLINDPKDFASTSSKRGREEIGSAESPNSKRQRNEEAAPLPHQEGLPENESDQRVDTELPDPESSAQHTGEQEGGQEDTPTYGHSATVLPCGHVFGRECLYKWTTEHNSCPICRAPILSEEELQALHSSDDTSSRGNNGPDATQQSTFESIRRLLYERSPEPAVVNTIRENQLNTSSAESITTGTTASNQTDGSRVTENSNTNENRQQPESAQDITNDTNNQSRTFSTSFIFFLSDPNANQPTALTTPPVANTGVTPTAAATTATSPAATGERSTENQQATNPVPVNTADNNTTHAAGRTNTPVITHFNDLPEDNQRLLGNIRAILRRAHEERTSTGRGNDDNNDDNNNNNTATNAENTNSQQNSHLGHDFAQTTRRFFNLLPLLGRRQQGQNTNTQIPSNIQPPPANPHTDPALENRYSAYLEHLNTLRNGNRPSSEANGSRFRLPSFFRLGRNTAGHRHEGGSRTSAPLSNPQIDPLLSSNIFSSGVASYRHANGVRTVNFTGDIPEPPNQTSQTSSSNVDSTTTNSQPTSANIASHTEESSNNHAENPEISAVHTERATSDGNQNNVTDATNE